MFDLNGGRDASWKYRESFRPFAISVLREDVADRPYMLLVADVMTPEQQKLFGIEKLSLPRSAR